MILIDPRVGSKELLPIIQRLGNPCMLSPLEFADAAFEGNGPHGTILVGIERKSLHDMLNCIDDRRYSAFQKPGMKQMYGQSFLIVEGHWKPHDPEGCSWRDSPGALAGACAAIGPLRPSTPSYSATY